MNVVTFSLEHGTIIIVFADEWGCIKPEDADPAYGYREYELFYVLMVLSSHGSSTA